MHTLAPIAPYILDGTLTCGLSLALSALAQQKSEPFTCLPQISMAKAGLTAISPLPFHVPLLLF